MVKGSIKIARDAHYEAEQRTVGVSLKPAVGKQIIADSLIQAAASGSFSPSFNAERFIFGKIREYTLRAASHANNVAVVSAVSGRNETHSNEDIHESLHYRVAAQVVLASSRCTMESIPKILQTHVAAQMLHDAHVPVLKSDKTVQDSQRRDEVREEFQLSSTLRSWARAHGIHLLHKDLQVLSKSMAAITTACAASCGNQSSSFNGGSTLSAAESARSSFLFGLSLLISCAMNSAHKDAGSSPSNQNKSKVETQSSVETRAANSSPSLGACAPWLGLRKESGFGTSPIWYQQSMATGPPQQASRWIGQKSPQ